MASIRHTPQRAAIREAIGGIDEFVSAQHLKEIMSAEGENIGLATIYRNLQALAEAGELDVVQDPGGQVLYRRCETPIHHHHLICWNCGRTTEFEAPAAEALLATIAADAGYSDIHHTIELRGLCAVCRAAGVDPRHDEHAHA